MFLSLPLPDVPYPLAGCAAPLTKVSSPDSTPEPTCLTEDSGPHPHCLYIIWKSCYWSLLIAHRKINRPTVSSKTPGAPAQRAVCGRSGDILLRGKVQLCDVGLRVIIKTIKCPFSSTRLEMMIPPHSSESTLRRESEQT